MLKLRKLSGREVVKILCNKFGFSIKRQKGSHIVLAKLTEFGKVITIVPNHKEIKTGTFKSILRLAKIKEEEFLEYT